MGASILPITIHKNKLYLLFGKENKYNDTPGWSDFGGGTEKGESFKKTAEREGMEELTGFLGMEKDIKKLMRAHGTYNIDFGDKRIYRIHMVPMNYDDRLPELYNNNHAFLERKLSPSLIKTSKIFEKDEIRWISEDDLPKMRNRFRSFYRVAVDDMLTQKDDIRKFVKKVLRKKGTKKKTLRANARTRNRNRKATRKSTRKKGTGKKTRRGGRPVVAGPTPQQQRLITLLEHDDVSDPLIQDTTTLLINGLPDKLYGIFDDNPELLRHIQDIDDVEGINKLATKLTIIAEEYARLKGIGRNAIEQELWAEQNVTYNSNTASSD